MTGLSVWGERACERYWVGQWGSSWFRVLGVGVKKGLRRKEVLAWLGLERSDCLSYAWADSVNGAGAALGNGGGRGRVLIA